MTPNASSSPRSTVISTLPAARPLATRELLELLAAAAGIAAALTCGVLDYAQETPLEDVLIAMDRPIPRRGRAQPRRRGRGL